MFNLALEFQRMYIITYFVGFVILFYFLFFNSKIYLFMKVLLVTE